MRIFEILLVLTAIVSLFRNKIDGGRSKWVRYLPALSVVILPLHYFIEGSRWQMYPVYLIFIIMIISSLYEGFTGSTAVTDSKNTIMGRFKNILAVILIFISTAASLILPVSKIPEPQGVYKIGTTSYYVEDDSRKEIYSGDAGESRKIMIQMWYPADSVKGLKRAPWLEGGEPVAEGLARLMKLPDFLLTHLALIKSNSYENAKLSGAQEKYPVIIISHGWTGFRNIHTNFAEMLAARGYVVAAIDHTYGSLATAFDNGETVYLNKDALPSGLPKDEYARYSNNLVSTYAGDIITTINKIEEMNKEEKNFKSRLDLDKIGVMGHSTGGGGSVKASILDKRIKAVFGLDPWVEPVDRELIAKGLDVPAVFLRSEQWKEKPNNANLFALIDNSKNDTQLYSIAGTIHNDFTIVNIVSPVLKYLKLSGTLDGKKSMDIQQDYVLSFFDKYLKGENNDLLNQKNSPYIEVMNILSKGKQLN